MMRRAFLVVWLGVLATWVAQAEDPLPVLTLEEALANADAHLPTLRQQKANTHAADARVREAMAPLLPQLSANASYMRRTANFAAQPGVVPLDGGVAAAATGSGSFNTVNFYSTNVTLSQMVYDFGTTIGGLRAAEWSAGAQRESQDATLLQARLDVRTAFFAAQAEKALLDVARSNLSNIEKHQHQIEGFVEVGTRAQIDLAQAKTDTANARSQLISAENNYEIGKAMLNQRMGVEQSTAYEINKEEMPPIQDEDAGGEELIQRAYHGRPEVRAQEKVVQSNYAKIASARGGYFPSVGVSTTFSDQGTSATNNAWNWNAQAFLSWNIFDGLATAGRTDEAQANYDAQVAQLDIVKQGIRLEVEQQRWSVRAAKESLVAAKEAEFNAHERLTLAEGRYQTGIGSIIELGDAQLAYTSAAASRVQAEFNLASARASLMKAFGEK